MNGFQQAQSQGQSAKDDDKRAFSERYSFCVSRLGMKDIDVARRSGIPQNTISRWANAQSLPDARYIFVLADVLKVSPRWLITGEGLREIPTEVNMDSGDETHLLGLFRSLDQDRAAHLLKLAGILRDSQVLQRINHVSPDDQGARQ
jgi:transcriptional regulator with XRE-family HTH domain